MAQNITLMGASYSAVPAVTLPKTGGGTASFTDVTDTTAAAADVASGKYFYTAAGVRTQGTATGGSPTLQTITKSYTPTESQQTETITAGSGYDGIEEVDVTVGAISSTYVGSGITQRSSSDLTASGATVTVPSGYYSAQASKAVASGTTGTPTATKGTVSNHSISVTPSVTNTTGYITGSTKTGTAVTVSASELVSGSETKTENGTYDVTNLAQLVVNVASGSSKNAQVVQGTTRTISSTLTAIGAEMTVEKTGTYDVYWSAFRTSTSSYTFGSQLFIDGTAYGSENTTWSNHVQDNHLQNVSLTANQKIRVYGRNSRGTSYYLYAPTLVIVEA